MFQPLERQFIPAHVASLGAWCQTTHQLKASTLPIISSPFDWIVTPIRSVCEMLDDDCSKAASGIFLRREDVDPVCASYGAVYAHEFTRDDAGKPIVSSDECGRVNSKMRYKMKKLRTCAMSGDPILFVRMGGHASPGIPWPYLEDETPLSVEDCMELERAVTRLCGHDNFRILITCFEETTQFSTGKISHHTEVAALRWPEVHPATWEGETQAWSALLQRFSST